MRCASDGYSDDAAEVDDIVEADAPSDETYLPSGVFFYMTE